MFPLLRLDRFTESQITESSTNQVDNAAGNFGHDFP